MPDFLCETLTPKFLPCPFCGEKPAVRNHGGVVFIFCKTPRCPANSDGAFEPDEVKALAKWNTRAPVTTKTPC